MLKDQGKGDPCRSPGEGACDLLGLDPLYVANEGIVMAVVEPSVAKTVLAVMRQHAYGVNAHIIGDC